MTAAPDEYVLALDLGTSGCKAALVDMHGRVHDWESQDVQTQILSNGSAEQRPQDWIDAIVTASRTLIARMDNPAQVKAICPNTQGEGTVPVDENGTPLSNAILWMDTRGAPYVRDTLGGTINISGYAVPKLLQYIRLTGGAPSLTGKDPVGHMLFIKNEWPEIYARTYKFLGVLDYVLFQLTGRMVSSYDYIVTSWVTDNRNPSAATYNPALCAMIGIPPEKFPELVASTDIVGPLEASMAQRIGLSPDCQVVAGAMDTSACAVGSGAVGIGDPHLYLGTSSWIGAHVPQKKTDILSAIASIPCAIPDTYLMTALQATAAGNLRYIKETLFDDGDSSPQESPLPNIYETFNALVESSTPGAKGILYTPWIYGERAPVEDHSIRASLHNISLHHTRADMMRAVYEGIALNARWLLAPVEKFLGGSCDSIALVGGGAQSDVWCQIFADVLERPIRQIEDPIAANIRGAAYIASVALGHITFDDVPQLTKTKKLFEPRTQHAPLYDLHFREFKNLYSAHKNICRRLNDFHQQS